MTEIVAPITHKTSTWRLFFSCGLATLRELSDMKKVWGGKGRNHSMKGENDREAVLKHGAFYVCRSILVIYFSRFASLLNLYFINEQYDRHKTATLCFYQHILHLLLLVAIPNASFSVLGVIMFAT